MTNGALPALRSIAVGNRRVSWREAGGGVPLVLVHGIGGHSGAWRKQFSAFAQSCRVIAWDAPGYGGSDPLPAGERYVEDYAGSLIGLLTALGIDEAHMVGHSLGAIIVLAASRQGAVRPRSLTLLQPVSGSGRLPADQRERLRLARIAEMTALGPVEFANARGRQILSKSAVPDAAREAVEVMRAVSKEGYLAAWDMMCEADIYSLLGHVCPTQVICGSDDPVAPPGDGQALADRIPGASFTCMEGVGHYASIEAPDELNALLRRSVASSVH